MPYDGPPLTLYVESRPLGHKDFEERLSLLDVFGQLYCVIVEIDSTEVVPVVEIVSVGANVVTVTAASKT